MKKSVLLLASFFLFQLIFAQEKPLKPNVTVKWAPTGLIVGSVSLQVEYNFGGTNSLTAKIGLPVSAHHKFDYEGDNADFNLKATSFLAGYRMYLGKKHLTGLYVEPFFKYVHHISEGGADSYLSSRPVHFSFTNDYNGGGVGMQLGAQFLLSHRFVIDLFFLGPEINSASNNFKAIETTSFLPWTSSEASDAQQEIHNFIDKFPFIRKKTKIMVDPDNRTVTGDFKGALPGMRIGFSLGYAF